jgi:hypothetical protein
MSYIHAEYVIHIYPLLAFLEGPELQAIFPSEAFHFDTHLPVQISRATLWRVLIHSRQWFRNTWSLRHHEIFGYPANIRIMWCFSLKYDGFHALPDMPAFAGMTATPEILCVSRMDSRLRGNDTEEIRRVFAMAVSKPLRVQMIGINAFFTTEDHTWPLSH